MDNVCELCNECGHACEQIGAMIGENTLRNMNLHLEISARQNVIVCNMHTHMQPPPAPALQ
jgi:hypothetical protein